MPTITRDERSIEKSTARSTGPELRVCLLDSLLSSVVQETLAGVHLLDRDYHRGSRILTGVDQEVDEARQLFSIIVILVGMLALTYTVGMLIQAIVEGQLDKAMGAKRMNKEIEKLKGHVIVCGFGRIGQNLSHRLSRH